MEHFKVLIIGAGASGMAAAVRLLENGFNNFRIIEAQTRIGGRINSTWLGNVPIELGAEWIHGESGNVVYELASKYNLTDNTGEEFFRRTKFFDHSGRQVNKDVSFALATAFYEIMNVEERDINEETLKGSIGDYFKVEFGKAVNDLRQKLNIDESLCQKFLKTFENWENSIDGSHSWYETSLTGHLEYWECPGNIITRWKNNCYNTLFNLLAKKMPGQSAELPVDEKILFNKEVCRINWNRERVSSEANVNVLCTDGSVYTADHVLVTCSLGVLKERSGQMFHPSLPEKKLLAIENLGFGTVDKIFLSFSHRWWKDDFDGFAFLWSDDERENDTSGWLNGVICFHPLDEECPVLRGWITGEAAQAMEKLPDREVVQGLNYLLDKFLGSSFTVPSIDRLLTSKWHADPHFRGSYSCRLMATEEAKVSASDLAEPVCNSQGLPVLLFGGEASHDHYFSTVHGAVEAGRREANRLLPFVMNTPKLKKKHYSVVIVGAGVSGLAAAKTLTENGLTDFIVLEAQSKAGGRVSSVQVDDYHLELGAQWIHGEKNEVFDICRDNDLITDVHSSEGEGLYLRETGEVVDDSLVSEVSAVINGILEDCERYAHTGTDKSFPQSVGGDLLAKFNEYLDGCRDRDTDEVRQLKWDLLNWHIRFQLIDNSCEDLHDLSARAWGLYKFCGGNDYVNFKRGYGSLVEALTKGLPENTLLLDTPVQRIAWCGVTDDDDEDDNSSSRKMDYGVKVTCKNGLTFRAQHIIVTCSLGYLKSNHKTMFYPPLPNYLSQGISMLDIGILDKIFLIYDEAWWSPDAEGFQLVWSQPKSPSSDGQHRFWGKYMTGFDVIKKDKPVLLGWIGGEGAKIVEHLTEEDVGRDATNILRKFCKKPDIPLPKRVLRSTWWTNEYIRGGYSHITVRCDELGIDGSNLAKPVYVTDHRGQRRPTVLLAGECTHQHYYSTVHGAYESGQNQARVVLKYRQESGNV